LKGINVITISQLVEELDYRFPDYRLIAGALQRRGGGEHQPPEGPSAGRPLIPLLFILAMEPLPRLFAMATEAGLLSPVAGSISCSLYADDVALFIKPTTA
jgi:hypothetical protein